MSAVPDYYRIATIIVGAVLIATGLAKAVRPIQFRQHLTGLGWLAGQLIGPAVVAAAAFEGAWGTALILEYRRDIVFPLSILALIALSAESWIAVRSGRAEDCGCYGGVIRPSIYQSVGLNVLYSSLILFAWSQARGSAPSDRWMALAILGIAALLGSVASIRQNYQLRKGITRVPSPLVPGQRWNQRWSGGSIVNGAEEFLVSFLGPDCPHCKRWVKVANAMEQSPSLPKVLGVVSVDARRLAEFKNEYEIRFPVARISPAALSRLAPAVPTSVLVKNGTIDKIWVGNVPPDFATRFITAFFPTAS